MTKKRFVADNEYVMQNGEVYVVCGGEHSADVIATALNESLEENERLKKENEHIETCFKMADSTYHMLLKQYQNIEIALSKYRKENEQLKQSYQVLSDMCDEYLSSKDFLEHENEWLKKEHKRIQKKVCRLLNHLCDVENCITREQVKEWWNNEIGDFE